MRLEAFLEAPEGPEPAESQHSSQSCSPWVVGWRTKLEPETLEEHSAQYSPTSRLAALGFNLRVHAQGPVWEKGMSYTR